ncbi:hypothetical protein ExPECSC052_03051 [Escherichia coli]|nr:hypothetical protein ExPECSC052_03051 [Escherichia coli]
MTSDNLDSKPTIEDVDFNHLICVAGGIIEDLKGPFIFKAPENIRRLLNHKGVNEIR